MLQDAPPSRFVLWCHTPGRLETPRALFTSAPLDTVARWRSANRWADAVPLIAFGGPEMAPLGIPFGVPNAGGVPYLVENAPPEVWTSQEHPSLGWSDWVPDGPADFGSSLDRLVSMVKRCARLIQAPAWELCADASEGVIALALASVYGRSVALGAGAPTALTARVGQDLDVSVTFREHSAIH
jgi:hypothetical protein